AGEEEVGASPRPAWGERSNSIADRIRVRGSPRESRCLRPCGDHPTPASGARETGSGARGRPDPIGTKLECYQSTRLTTVRLNHPILTLPPLRSSFAYGIPYSERSVGVIPLDPLPNLIDQVYARILEAITDRTLQPGQRIRQNELADKLGVS